MEKVGLNSGKHTDTVQNETNPNPTVVVSDAKTTTTTTCSTGSKENAQSDGTHDAATVAASHSVDTLECLNDVRKFPPDHVLAPLFLSRENMLNKTLLKDDFINNYHETFSEEKISLSLLKQESFSGPIISKSDAFLLENTSAQTTADLFDIEKNLSITKPKSFPTYYNLRKNGLIKCPLCDQIECKCTFINNKDCGNSNIVKLEKSIFSDLFNRVNVKKEKQKMPNEQEQPDQCKEMVTTDRSPANSTRVVTNPIFRISRFRPDSVGRCEPNTVRFRSNQAMFQTYPIILYWHQSYGTPNINLLEYNAALICRNEHCVDHIPISLVNFQRYSLYILVDHSFRPSYLSSVYHPTEISHDQNLAGSNTLYQNKHVTDNILSNDNSVKRSNNVKSNPNTIHLGSANSRPIFLNNPRLSKSRPNLFKHNFVKVIKDSNLRTKSNEYRSQDPSEVKLIDKVNSYYEPKFISKQEPGTDSDEDRTADEQENDSTANPDSSD